MYADTVRASARDEDHADLRSSTRGALSRLWRRRERVTAAATDEARVGGRTYVCFLQRSRGRSSTRGALSRLWRRRERVAAAAADEARVSDRGE
jgi:lambda repressor-like predicted transcriptional regulator